MRVGRRLPRLGRMVCYMPVRRWLVPVGMRVLLPCRPPPPDCRWLRRMAWCCPLPRCNVLPRGGSPGVARRCLAARLFIHGRDVVVMLGAVMAVGGLPSQVHLLAPGCLPSPHPRLTVLLAQRAVSPLARCRRCLGGRWVARVAVVVVVGVGVQVEPRCLGGGSIAVRRPRWVVGSRYIEGRGRRAVVGGWMRMRYLGGGVGSVCRPRDGAFGGRGCR